MTGATILGVQGLHLDADETAFLRDADPWGFILFARNVESPAQVRRLTADLRAAVGRDAPVFVDQEGGRVQRLRAPHWREWTAPLDFVAQYGTAAGRALRLRYLLIGLELRAVGIDADCAPCLDVARPETHPFLRNRCLSDDPAAVGRLGRAVADGLIEAGVLPVMKHMPGHGRAVADSHHALPQADVPVTELAADFAPFKALADLPLGMTAHVVYPALDGSPATTSATMVARIRHDIGFDGLLMTDDIGMNALSGQPWERAAAAIAAGCDVVLHCNGNRHEMERVVGVAGRLTLPAQERAARALAARRVPGTVDIAAVEGELRALINA